jgi:hypothetical protein
LLPCPVEWHGGFLLHAETLAAHPNFCGPDIVELGRSIAVDDWLDPRIIGEAVATGQYDPQALKYVWHYLAKFGAPR